MVKFMDARYQLSEEEQNSQNAKVREALEKIGGKSILLYNSSWSSEQWLGFGVEEFPDVDAVQKYADLLFELDHFRYIESVSMLGTKFEM